MLTPLAPLDALRARALRLPGRRIARVLTAREPRVSFLASSAVLVALGFALFAPVFTLVFTPLALGVPHLVADVRYLVVRQALHTRLAVLLSVAPLLALQWFAPSAALACAAVALSALVARAPLATRLSVAVPALAVAVWSHTHAELAALAFAHAHNLVALALWVAWSRARRHTLPALVAFVLGVALIASGACDTLVSRAGALAPYAGLHVDLLARGLSPSTSPLWVVRSLALFAFAQSVHYAVWTRLVPEEDRARPTPRTFLASHRALVRDLGRPFVSSAALVLVALCVHALWDAASARAAYFRLALVHGPLELCAAALVLLERGQFQREPARA